MNKVLKFARGKYEIINFTIISLFLLLACYFEIFAYAVAVLCFIIAIFVKPKQIFNIILFTFSFQVIFKNSNDIPLYNILLLSLAVIWGIKYLVEVFKRRKKLNFKVIIPILGFLIYLTLPVHNFAIDRFANYLSFFALLYLAFEYRKEINFKKLVFSFYLGSILSCLFYLAKFNSTRLSDLIINVHALSNCNYIRFSGLIGHPNDLGASFLICLSAICILMYQGKINLVLFLGMIISIFVPAYLSISRNFIVTFVILAVVFVILYTLRYRRKFLLVTSTLILSLVIIVLCCLYPTKLYLIRFDVLPRSAVDSEIVDNTDGGIENTPPISAEENTEEWWQLVYNGEVEYNPGREGIWHMYLTNWKSSTKNIIFGRGIGAKDIGQVHAHNIVIKLLWTHGLTGICFLILIFICFTNFKSLKKHILLSLLMLLCPILVDWMFEVPSLIFELVIATFAIVLASGAIAEAPADVKEERSK